MVLRRLAIFVGHFKLDAALEVITSGTLDRSTVFGAEEAFCCSIDLGDQQSALSWRLCASTSLARLQFRQGRREEAREALAGTYARFSEGFETADLKAAEHLLATMN